MRFLIKNNCKAEFKKLSLEEQVSFAKFLCDRYKEPSRYTAAMRTREYNVIYDVVIKEDAIYVGDFKLCSIDEALDFANNLAKDHESGAIEGEMIVKLGDKCIVKDQ